MQNISFTLPPGQSVVAIIEWLAHGRVVRQDRIVGMGMVMSYIPPPSANACRWIILDPMLEAQQQALNALMHP